MTKFIVTSLLAIFLSCNTQQDSTNINSPSEIKKIKEVLSTQQKYWNDGDIDGFMQGYWNSAELIFTSDVHMPAYGWQNVLERYKNSYPTKESMGEFKFIIIDIKLTSGTTANLYGTWELIRKNDNPKGGCWLNLEKIDEKWLITKDSTVAQYW